MSRTGPGTLRNVYEARAHSEPVREGDTVRILHCLSCHISQELAYRRQQRRLNLTFYADFSENKAKLRQARVKDGARWIYFIYVTRLIINSIIFRLHAT